MLYHAIEEKFKYFYVFSNNLLFDKAFTVSSKKDEEKLFQHIVDLDLINNYYLKKPSSSWILIGLPNLKVNVYLMKGTLLG